MKVLFPLPRHALILVLTPFLALPARADVGYQVGLAANYSDNVTRSSGEGTEDVISNLNASAMWRNDSPKLAAEVFGQMSYLRYYDGTFDDEVVPRADVNVNWDIVPARLDWVLEDRFGQIASDPFAAFTPDNIENTNVLRTGPDFIFGSSPSQLLTWSIRAEDQYYEVQPVDNQRLSSRLELERRMTENQSLAVGVYGETIEFEDQAVGTDYSLYEAYVALDRSLGSNNFTVEAGGTRLDIEDESVDGVLGRLTASRQLESNWYLQLTGEYSFTDSGSRFLIGREQSSVGPGQSVDDDNLAAASSPLRLKMFGFEAAHQTPRQAFSFESYWEDETFELDSRFDRSQAGGSLSYEFSLTPLNSILLFGAYKSVRFDTGNRDDEHLEAEFRFRRHLTSNLSVDFRLAHARRTSSDADSEYEERVAGLSITYESDMLGAMQSRPR